MFNFLSFRPAAAAASTKLIYSPLLSCVSQNGVCVISPLAFFLLCRVCRRSSTPLGGGEREETPPPISEMHRPLVLAPYIHLYSPSVCRQKEETNMIGASSFFSRLVLFPFSLPLTLTEQLHYRFFKLSFCNNAQLLPTSSQAKCSVSVVQLYIRHLQKTIL